MPLNTESIRYLKDTPKVIYLVVCLLLDLVLHNIASNYLIKITNGSYNLLTVYLAIKLVNSTLLSYITTNLSLTISREIEIKFYNEYTEQYAKLTRESKDQNPHIEFEKKLSNASGAIMFNIQHGIPNFCRLISSILSGKVRALHRRR